MHKNLKGGLNKQTVKRGWSLVWGFSVLQCIVLYFVVFLQSTIIDLTVFDVARVHVYTIIALYFVFVLYHYFTVLYCVLLSGVFPQCVVSHQSTPRDCLQNSFKCI